MSEIESENFETEILRKCLATGTAFRYAGNANEWIIIGNIINSEKDVSETYIANLDTNKIFKFENNANPEDIQLNETNENIDTVITKNKNEISRLSSMNGELAEILQMQKSYTYMGIQSEWNGDVLSPSLKIGLRDDYINITISNGLKLWTKNVKGEKGFTQKNYANRAIQAIKYATATINSNKALREILKREVVFKNRDM